MEVMHAAKPCPSPLGMVSEHRDIVADVPGSDRAHRLYLPLAALTISTSASGSMQCSFELVWTGPTSVS